MDEKPKDFEQLYNLRVAAEMIPFPSAGALRQWLRLHREEFPRLRYRKTSMGGYQILIYKGDVDRIQMMILKTLSETHIGAPGYGSWCTGRPKKAKSGLIASIIEKATGG